jgi:hypothetical protein
VSLFQVCREGAMGKRKQWPGGCEPETAFLGCIKKENGSSSKSAMG